ncbi:transcription termination factor MTEF18, mitochondrial [Rutidosis leptorrhynchoides]|uniref:transcription termination factor MTEF18, mitochondrial n=1 Tax=Rutidosis leptorrhynchoides TaxID=125765 RepID=UPI003A99A873
MLIRGISKSLICICNMISELHYVFCTPTVCKNACTGNGLSFLSVKRRNFCVYETSIQGNAGVVYSHQSVACVNGNGYRISRVVRTEAQTALFDYLHFTRGFHFTDAEYISKNSPQFVQNLLSVVDDEQDVSRALSKYFRYNPINEFEPFLESLGLNPFEYPSLLPKSLIFLGDDDLLLDNFHVLCGYGIPRTKIGQIYKEAKEIFRYDNGVLSMKLKAYENLGLSKSTIISLITCCPSLLIGNIDNKFLVVLDKLKGIGFGKEWIGSYVSDKTTLNWDRMLDTMSFLLQVGYNDEQMKILFTDNPALLFEGSGKRVYVLVGQLLKLGFKMNQIYDLFLKSPQILSSKCAKNLWTAVCFLAEIGMETEVIASIVATHMEVLGSNSLKAPITVMNSLKIKKDALCRAIKKDPLQLINLATKTDTKSIENQDSNTIVERRNFLLRLGYIENSDELSKALRKFRGRGDQLQERFDCLVQAGLDYNVVSSMIKRAPSVLNQTKDLLEKKIDCLVNRLGYPLEAVVVFPSYLCYDIQRINLRFSMYLWLLERGAAKPKLSLSTILACSDVRFVKYFVHIHPEGVATWESLKNSLKSKSIQDP